jgi:hypothetical protein
LADLPRVREALEKAALIAEENVQLRAKIAELGAADPEWIRIRKQRLEEIIPWRAMNVGIDQVIEYLTAPEIDEKEIQK